MEFSRGGVTTIREGHRQRMERNKRVHDVDHEEIRDLLAVYALGALPADEHEQVRAHVRWCAECCFEALLFTEAAVGLAKEALRHSGCHVCRRDR